MTDRIQSRGWPAIRFKDKRAVTADEPVKFFSGERNPEWQTYFKTLWHAGGAQSDVGGLGAKNIDWNTTMISLHRRKTGSLVQLHFGAELESIPLWSFRWPPTAETVRRSSGAPAKAKP